MFRRRASPSEGVVTNTEMVAGAPDGAGETSPARPGQTSRQASGGEGRSRFQVSRPAGRERSAPHVAPCCGVSPGRLVAAAAAVARGLALSWESAAGQSASISMEARASTRLPRAHSSPPEAEGLPPRPPADRSAPPLDRSERARHARARAVVVVQCVRTCATKLSCIHRLSRRRAHTRAGVRSDGATSHRALRDTRRSSVLAFPRRC